MPTIGPTFQPNDGYWEKQSSPNHGAMLFEMPEDGIITRLGQWIAGAGSNGTMRLCVWAGESLDPGNDLLAQTDLITVIARTQAFGNTDRYEGDLQTPLQLNAGDEFYCGFAYNPAKNYQLDGNDDAAGGAENNKHYHKSNATWPSATFNSPTGGNHGFGDYGIGSYVANYDEVSKGWVYRSGVWVRLDAVSVRRSGAWTDLEVGIYRGTSWVAPT